MKKFIIIALILVISLVFLKLLISKETKSSVTEKKVVTVSTYFIYDIVKYIASDSVQLVHILPFGTDPHSFEPTPKLMVSIENSSLVILSGAGLEPWVDAIEFKSKVIDLSKSVKLRELGSQELESHEHHHEDSAHNTIDPHYWLDFANMHIAAEVVTKELVTLLPENRSIYLKNRDKYLSMLEKLEKSYAKHLSSCRVNTVILNHNAIGYLAQKYNFHTESLSGLSPEADPTPSDIKRIFTEIKKSGVSTLFFENFVSNKVMQTVAKDAHIKLESLSPLGNITADEAKSNATYETVMYSNLEKLSKALQCN